MSLSFVPRKVMNAGGSAAVASLALILAEHALKTHPLGRAIVFCLTAYAIVRAVADRERTDAAADLHSATAPASETSTAPRRTPTIKRLLSARA